MGGSTHREQFVYLHVLRCARDSLTLPALKARVLNAIVLTGGDASVEQSGET